MNEYNYKNNKFSTRYIAEASCKCNRHRKNRDRSGVESVVFSAHKSNETRINTISYCDNSTIVCYYEAYDIFDVKLYSVLFCIRNTSSVRRTTTEFGLYDLSLTNLT